MRFVILSLICFLPLFSWAEGSKMHRVSEEDISDIRQVLDTKIFHDSFFVEAMMKDLYDHDKSGISSNPALLKEVGYENIFDERDSSILRYESATRVVRNKLTQIPWDEQVKVIRKDPFEAIVGLIENQEVPELIEEEMDLLNSVDKKAVTQVLEMLTESGPDVGASNVPVIYNEGVNLE